MSSRGRQDKIKVWKPIEANEKILIVVYRGKKNVRFASY